MSDANNLSELKPQDIREMKNRLHHLKPAIIIGTNGLTDEIFQEIDNQLDSNELIKIRTHANSSEELAAIAEEICNKVKAILIQTIGYIIAVYRKNLQPEE